MDEKLTLNNGTELQGHALETNVRLFVYIYGSTMKEVFDLLIEPENTKVIRTERYGEKETFKGYKHLCTVSEEMNGMISASLKK